MIPWVSLLRWLAPSTPPWRVNSVPLWPVIAFSLPRADQWGQLPWPFFQQSYGYVADIKIKSHDTHDDRGLGTSSESSGSSATVPAASQELDPAGADGIILLAPRWPITAFSLPRAGQWSQLRWPFFRQSYGYPAGVEMESHDTHDDREFEASCVSSDLRDRPSTRVPNDVRHYQRPRGCSAAKRAERRRRRYATKRSRQRRRCYAMRRLQRRWRRHVVNRLQLPGHHHSGARERHPLRPVYAVELALYAAARRGTATPSAILPTKIWRAISKRVAAHRGGPDVQPLKPMASFPVLCTDTLEWVEAVLEELDSKCGTAGPAINLRAMSARSQVDPLFMWVQVSLWFLAHDPASIIRFLAATQDHFEPPHGLVKDALASFAGCFRLSPAPRPDLYADILCKLIARQRGQDFSEHVICVWFALRRCGDEAAVRVAHAVEEGEIHLHTNSWFHLISYLVQNDEFERAVDSLKRAKDSGALVGPFNFRSGVALILRKAIERPEGLRIVLEVVDKVVAMGFELNGNIRDTIIKGAVIARDAKTAFAVHDTLAAEGLQPTPITFTHLLSACQIGLDDAERLNQTIRAIIEQADLRINLRLATSILFTLALYHGKHHPQSAYSTIIDAYSEFFDAQPLLNLHLPWVHSKPPPLEGLVDRKTLMQPPDETINVMIGTWVQHVIHNVGDPSDLWPIYHRWRTLAEAGEQPYMSLASTDYTANAFLEGFVTQQHTIPHAMQVIRDMRTAPPAAALEHGFVQARPTVRSWTIVINGLQRHSKWWLVREAKATMRADGVKPDEIASHVFLQGAASQQDYAEVRRLLVQRAKDGLAWTPWTNNALKRVRNQQRLDSELREAGIFADDVALLPQEGADHAPNDDVSATSIPADAVQYGMLAVPVKPECDPAVTKGPLEDAFVNFAPIVGTRPSINGVQDGIPDSGAQHSSLASAVPVESKSSPEDANRRLTEASAGHELARESSALDVVNDGLVAGKLPPLHEVSAVDDASVLDGSARGIEHHAPLATTVPAEAKMGPEAADRYSREAASAPFGLRGFSAADADLVFLDRLAPKTPPIRTQAMPDNDPNESEREGSLGEVPTSGHQATPDEKPNTGQGG